MRIALLILVVLLLAGPAWGDEAAGAARRFYLGVEGGMGVINRFDTTVPFVGQTGFEVGGAAVLRAGWQWRDHFRFDGQVGWEGAEVDGLRGRLDIAYATANAYYDFGATDAWVRPYLGVGLGVAGGWLRSDLPVAVGPFGDQSGVGMAYLVAGGGRFPITDRLTLACAWQFLGTVALIDSPAGSSIDPSMHAFMVGLHHSF